MSQKNLLIDFNIMADQGKLIEYWMNSSDKDYKTMVDLFKTKNYHWSLFIGHLVVEKLLKALYVKKTNEIPPMIHDLRRIAEKAGIEVGETHRIALDSITRFNINARYDDYKETFYALCNLEFTTEWIGKIEEIRQWIRKQLSE
jgi:HEPN domain-containing protein